MDALLYAQAALGFFFIIMQERLNSILRAASAIQSSPQAQE